MSRLQELQSLEQARLLRHSTVRETWNDYRRATTAGPLQGRRLMQALALADLRGRGGAGFPAVVKWRAVAEGPAPRVVIANGEEGEPLSVKDRYLLRLRPHAVIDGLLLARDAVEADRAIIYVSDAESETAVRTAVSERPDAEFVEIFRVKHSYVAGEESAAVRALNGGPAMPTEKPPRPHERGVDSLPTLVQNVETLAHVAWLAHHPDRVGDSGTTLVTISGACTRPGLYEAELGTPVGTVLADAGADPVATRGVLMGGYFAGLINRRVLDLHMDFDVLRLEGSGLGCSSMLVLGPQHCGVGIASAVLDFFSSASSRQCGTCLNGTKAMAQAAARLARQTPEAEDTARLQRWSQTLRGRGACSLLDGAAQAAGTLLREFDEDVAAHLADTRCTRCANIDHTRFVAQSIAVRAGHPEGDG